MIKLVEKKKDLKLMSGRIDDLPNHTQKNFKLTSTPDDTVYFIKKKTRVGLWVTIEMYERKTNTGFFKKLMFGGKEKDNKFLKRVEDIFKDYKLS